MSIVMKRPSARANHAWEYLIPDGGGWIADEWRGGSCAAIVTYIDVDGQDWEVCIMPDGDLHLPRVDEDWSTWEVHANRYDEENNGEWILGVTYHLTAGDKEVRTNLTLPAYRLGEDFPTEKVLAWVRSEVRAGRTIFV